MHHSTPLITTIVGGLVLAFLLGMLANACEFLLWLAISLLACWPVRLHRASLQTLHWHRSWQKSASSC